MCVFSLFNAYMKILIFTELIVLIVLQVWASVAVMGGDKFPTHLNFFCISHEKRQKKPKQINDDLRHITKKTKNRSRRTPYTPGFNVGFYILNMQLNGNIKH